MQFNLNLNQFIKDHVTARPVSLLQEDFGKYRNELNSRINGKKVMVIGGAGTIGSFYIKAILKFNIKSLVVVDINENGLTELVRDLRSSTDYNIPEDFITYPVNFGDRVFEKLFRHHGPFDIVANFAAHKHVRSEKDIFSIEAMIENNVLRARKLLDLLLEFPPEHFFCVSTDKAANPVNIMGASKKLMEELIMAYSNKLPIKTARFANVAFSNGSLPLGFLERLNKQQPWSCPMGIRRFFVSPEESGELCLMASIMGESGDIFFPKLDEEKDMIPFDKIALALINELGMEPDICQSEEEAKEKAERLRDGETERRRDGEKMVMRDAKRSDEIERDAEMRKGEEETGVMRDAKWSDAIGQDAEMRKGEEETERLREEEKTVMRDAKRSDTIGQDAEKRNSKEAGAKIKYPIYFFGSDTSGEKSFEEFYTEDEVLDNDSFINLGVIKNSVKRDISEIDAIFNKLETLFSSNNVTKAAIVDILKGYLPNFDHIETGKGLDSKM